MKAKLTLVLGLVVLISTTATPQLQAQATAYEGFNYGNGQSITAITSTATGLGNWTSTTGGIVGTTDSTGLTFGSLAVSGGSLDVTQPSAGQDNTWQFLSAPVTSSIADGSTLYTSYLFKFTGPNGGYGAADNFGLSVGNDTGPDHTMAALLQAYDNQEARIGYTDTENTSFASGNIFDGATYMIIGKWTNLGGASSGTEWILSLADFQAITAAGPVTEAALNANNMATGTTGPFTAGSFGLSQFVKIGDFMGTNVNYNVDEIRFASDLADVTPLVAIPEPSTYALWCMGLFGLYFLRRKRMTLVS
jgi:hypothetical protein